MQYNNAYILIGFIQLIALKTGINNSREPPGNAQSTTFGPEITGWEPLD